MNSYKRKLRKSISTGEIKKVLNLLVDTLDHKSKYYSEAIVLSSYLYNIQKQQMTNVIQSAEAFGEMNKLTSASLELIDKLQEKDFNNFSELNLPVIDFNKGLKFFRISFWLTIKYLSSIVELSFSNLETDQQIKIYLETLGLEDIWKEINKPKLSIDEYLVNINKLKQIINSKYPDYLNHFSLGYKIFEALSIVNNSQKDSIINEINKLLPFASVNDNNTLRNREDFLRYAFDLDHYAKNMLSDTEPKPQGS